MKKKAIFRILKGIGNGVIDSVPVLATIKNNIGNPHLADEEAPLKGMGSIDYTRLITTLLISGVAVAFIFKKISAEDFKYIADLLKSLS